jgi:polyphosphate kinase 2
VKKDKYEDTLVKLQAELVYLQKWVRDTGQRIVIIFEGRDAAGKGGVIKRITERVSPRVFRIVALPAPTDREKTQMYFQRYFKHFPAAGEIILFDRSWYNRLGVEHVMGFCSEEDRDRFIKYCDVFEEAIVGSGVHLIKYFFNVSRKTQEKRFLGRINDPRKQWKLSGMDLESYKRWDEYTAAYNKMFQTTSTESAPWHIVDADDKRSARIGCITHILSKFDYPAGPREMPDLPDVEHEKTTSRLNLDKCIEVPVP